MELHRHSEIDHTTNLHHLCCTFCGKRVSSAFVPVANELGPTLVVRAVIQCPECLEVTEHK